MTSNGINWQYFPKHSACTDFLDGVVKVFQDKAADIASSDNVGQESNDDTANREDDDRQLLRDLNPIAFAIVTRILNQPGPHQHLLP